VSRARDTSPLAPTIPAPPIPSGTPEETARVRKFLAAGAFLLLGFSLPLCLDMVFALKSELYSYILLVPLISAYLAWITRSGIYPAGVPLHPAWAAALWIAGLALLALAAQQYFAAGPPAPIDYLAPAMYSFALLLAGFACYFLGRQTLRVFAFPLAFLVFLGPLPTVLENGLETLLQHASSAVAQFIFEIAGMPVYRVGTYFQLPGFNMQVAPECSGIHSTLALFLTSLVAGQLFLHSAWKRCALASIVLPLALLRNGFRVFVIGELCVKVGPHMIDSWIHHRGGPFFFALSLIPFTLILYGLHRSERRMPKATLPPQN
jgi:exosortase C (VPDSG-CTERM-specific)